MIEVLYLRSSEKKKKRMSLRGDTAAWIRNTFWHILGVV
jgi:hypothetical protein